MKLEEANASRRPDAIVVAPALKRLKAVAIVLLALAIGCAAAALWARQRQNLVQGPWGLAVLPSGQVWLSVNDQLWRLDAEGRRQQVVDAAQVGLRGGAAILMPHPDGHLVAWSRSSTTLHLLAADDARPVANITPRWPEDLARHGDNAIHYAFAPDGRVAIAAGGGSAVALFDAQGRYLARSPADTFHFTNGLWWADGGWWCTDTNRSALVRLDDARLTETQRVTLSAQQGGWRFLGLAAASRGEAVDGQKPLGMVERLANGMERGHVVDVWPDGSQRAYPVPEGESAQKSRALAWLGDTLLVVDGQNFAIRRYSADRQQLDDWGDAAVRADLAQRHAVFANWRRLYRGALAGAVALLLLGLAVASLAQRLESRAKLAQAAPDLAAQANWKPGIAGMPTLSYGQLQWKVIQVLWPIFLLLGFMLAAQTIYGLLGYRSFVAVLVLSTTILAMALLTAVWVNRRLTHAIQNDEPFANARALRLLGRADLFWPLRQPGEQPRETLMLGDNRWLVLTNQRLLVFRNNAFDASLQASVPRGALCGAQILPLEQAPWWQRWQGRLINQGYLRFSLADGSAIAGVFICGQVARRMADLIHQAPTVFEKGDVPREAPVARQRALWQVLASLLIPGLGQWMQGRFGSGLLFFVIWLVLMGLFVFTAWVAWVPIMEVAPRLIWRTGLMVLAVNLTAAYDAWRLRDMARGQGHAQAR